MIRVRQRLPLPSGASGTYYSLPQHERRRLVPATLTFDARIDRLIEAA